MTKDNSTGKPKDFYAQGQQLFDSLNLPDDDDDTQDYVRGHYTVEQMLTWGKACAAAEREECAKVCESHVRYPSRLHFAEAIRARGNT